MINNTEILLNKISRIQHHIDTLINENFIKFLNPHEDLKVIEELYQSITDKKYLKFNAGCGSCIKEALLIINNWKQRELKKTPAIGSVEYNAKYVNAEDPFNPINPISAKKKGGENVRK